MPEVMTTPDRGRKRSRSRKNHLDTREECKKTLAVHINNQPGLSIELDQVSLHNPQKHGYFWVFQNKFIARHFSKTLSSLSMSACRQLSQEVGYTFKAIPTSAVVQGPNCDYAPYYQSPHIAPSTPNVDNNMTRTKLEGNNHSIETFSDSLSGEQEVNILKMQFEDLNSQHECAIRQLQDCRIHLQAAIERNERYDSFILNAFLKMDDMERTIQSLREGWFNALEGPMNGYSTEECQDHDS
ncbi:hypothetical protein FPOAC2_14296 [Fusarium poae]|uniref:Uncharacterized protein n=1 Tax=Fusarium poae TaxID=36050 RepID=A0A1B8A5V5_FUSPO|nr:uncharacterized protein FPOAC1_013026 [Fusarium poae]KAG8665048.1 hypothetical protein FPOAC1_013026 [Fusarium poae]OBS15860.1 hypothetical protein FPOA_13375 [Fusarium poae]OBS17022.1 hypothetical protein FPOA_12420 [Fusarium poae]OBS17051.1 hypothetical protein FPOA_12418 [Fusarium poae]OBS17494.1 hypothetical protein FPOA_12046 [Fusarium poae]